MYGTLATPNGTDDADRAKVSAATHWAIVSLTAADNPTDATIYFLIYSDNKVQTVKRNSSTGIVTVTDVSSGFTKDSIAYTFAGPSN